jgi:hypothetical protein
MDHLLSEYHIEELIAFDGTNNYLNATGKFNKILIRKERLVQEEDIDFILSDIIDENGDDILSSYIDTLYLHSYEDPRFISENRFTYCLCYFDKHTEIMGIKMGYYNKNNNNQDLYNFAKWEYEKNWQINNNKIIYSIEPLEIYKNNFEIVVQNKKNKNWDYWKNKYGVPRLSTNIFTVGNKHYAIFHSKNIVSKIKDASIIKGFAGEQQYFCGLLEVTKDYIPISYYKLPLLPSFNNYKSELREEYINWRQRTNSTWRVDIFFPTNVEIQKDRICIYGGINDCIAAKILIDTKSFISNIQRAEKILL